MSNTIVIEDLKQPVLSEMQKSAIEYMQTQSVDLSRESILREAEEKTGLNNWGKEDFLERLDLLCNEWDNDKGLNNIGRLSLRNKLVRHATSRLLIQEQFSNHPEIFEQTIEQPIIVVGLPRSGTTHLLNLMAADSRLRALPLWQSYEPVPLPGETATGDANDPRYQRCAEEWEMMKMMAPHVAAMHPMDPEHIHEELELMGPNFGSYNYEWLNYSPRWRDHYLQEDQSYQYEYMKDVLRLLQWQDRNSGNPTRWVLKCPQHLEQIPVLLKAFPDATIAITHRDPVSVIQSAITMLAYGQRMSRSRIMTTELLEYWTYRIKILLEACVHDRHLIPESQGIDVPFHVLIKDQLAMVKKIYQKANLEMTSTARSELQNFIDQHEDDYGRVVYNLERDFGTNPDALREQFEFYYEAFPVKRGSG
jgi:hypothetical protein